MRLSVSCIILLFLHYSSLAQLGKITGTVLDAGSKKPVEFATITLFDKTSGKVISGAISDGKGGFEIKDIPFGFYKVTVGFIGYKQRVLDSVTLSSSKKSVSFNTILLTSISGSLKAVTVTASAPVIENKIDKIVYNAANDITSQGSTTLEMLKKVPQVAVDVDGNVEVQGNSNILFLINGKPSSVFGNSVTDALASIPSSQIKSIEVITSPGAKYDAQGTGGIINIVLKESKIQGVNGNINLSGGTRLENGSFNLNIRNGNFGINTYFNGNAQLVSRTPSTFSRSSTDSVSQTTSLLTQDGYTDFKRNSYQSGLGFDWNITKTQELTGGFSYFHYANSNMSSIGQENNTYSDNGSPTAIQQSLRNSDSRSHSDNFDWNLNYHKKFQKEGQELSILYSASYGSPYNTFTQTQVYQSATPMPTTGLLSNNPGTNEQNNFSVDYSQPITEHFSFDAGVKASFQNISSVIDASVLNSGSQYVKDPNQSYSLQYHRNIYAAYASTNFSVIQNFLDVKLGVRMEHADTKIDFPNTTIPVEDNLVPSIILSHKLDKNQTIKISYSRRLERPDYGDVNPFVNLSDPYNLSTGNPLLLPEIGDNFELGYNRTFTKGGNIYVGLIERINSQDIKPVTTFYTSYKIGDSVYNDVSVTNRQNVGVEHNTGLTVYCSVPLTTKLNLRTNIFIMHRESVAAGTPGYDPSGNRFRWNLNLSYEFSKDFVGEVFGNYNSAQQNFQGRSPQSFTYNIAFRKQFWNKNGSLGITATNPFTEYVKQVSSISSPGYYSNSERQVPYRSFGISFSYKFGKLEFKKTKEEESNYQNDLPSQ